MILRSDFETIIMYQIQVLLALSALLLELIWFTNLTTFIALPPWYFHLATNPIPHWISQMVKWDNCKTWKLPLVQRCSHLRRCRQRWWIWRNINQLRRTLGVRGQDTKVGHLSILQRSNVPSLFVVQWVCATEREWIIGRWGTEHRRAESKPYPPCLLIFHQGNIGKDTHHIGYLPSKINPTLPQTHQFWHVCEMAIPTCNTLANHVFMVEISCGDEKYVPFCIIRLLYEFRPLYHIFTDAQSDSTVAGINSTKQMVNRHPTCILIPHGINPFMMLRGIFHPCSYSCQTDFE